MKAHSVTGHDNLQPMHAVLHCNEINKGKMALLRIEAAAQAYACAKASGTFLLITQHYFCLLHWHCERGQAAAIPTQALGCDHEHDAHCGHAVKIKVSSQKLITVCWVIVYAEPPPRKDGNAWEISAVQSQAPDAIGASTQLIYASTDPYVHALAAPTQQPIPPPKLPSLPLPALSQPGFSSSAAMIPYDPQVRLPPVPLDCT